jgi:hypothetical protein
LLHITTIFHISVSQTDVSKQRAKPKREIMALQQKTGPTPPTRPSWRLDNAQWSFLVSNDPSHSPPQLRWWWRAIGKNGVIWNSDDRFASLGACQSDAATHGFDGVRG